MTKGTNIDNTATSGVLGTAGVFSGYTSVTGTSLTATNISYPTPTWVTSGFSNTLHTTQPQQPAPIFTYEIKNTKNEKHLNECLKFISNFNYEYVFNSIDNSLNLSFSKNTSVQNDKDFINVVPIFLKNRTILNFIVYEKYDKDQIKKYIFDFLAISGIKENKNQNAGIYNFVGSDSVSIDFTFKSLDVKIISVDKKAYFERIDKKFQIQN